MWKYKQLYMPNHPQSRSNGCILEHRYVAEKIIGRLLYDEEVVHHIDEDVSNNSEDNLVVFKTQDDHARFHITGVMTKVGDTYMSPRLTRECENCKNVFEYTNNTIKFCSQDCFKKYSRVTERPSKEELIELLRNNSILKIGNMFGVSDNAIRKWCKYYDLPFKKNELKEFFIKL